MLADELAALRSQLDATYELALQAIPAHEVAENGHLKSNIEALKRHFAEAQSAWQVYSANLCAFEGGARGLTTASVDLFTNHCLIRETTARLEVLKHPPQGQ
jgi:uncharacterized protein YecT (DUF1311 family)